MIEGNGVCFPPFSTSRGSERSGARSPPRRIGSIRERNDEQGEAVKYRVVQWSTGNVGHAAVEGIATHPGLELVGVWAHSQEKLYLDLPLLAGRARTDLE